MNLMNDLPFKPDHLLKIANMRMPYGRYQGTRLIDLPEPYVVWYHNKGFPPGELGQLLGTLYEVKLNGLEFLFDKIKPNADQPR
jgi:uncharacterized protein